MTDRIGILTGGGDCPGLNAVIRAVVKSASRLGWETLGILNGFEGLLDPVSYRRLDHREMGSLLTAGGTVLGTTNRGRFAAKTGHGEQHAIPREILDEAKRNFEALASARPHLRGRRRLAYHRPAPVRTRPPGRGGAQDHRQRSRGHGDDLRLRLGRGLRHRCARPPAHHRGGPQPRDGARGDGTLRRLDRLSRRHRRRR